MKLLNFLTNKKYEFLWGGIFGLFLYLATSKFQSIGAVLIALVSFAVIKTSIQWFVGGKMLAEKSKKNTSKNPK